MMKILDGRRRQKMNNRRRRVKGKQQGKRGKRDEGGLMIVQ